MLTHDTRSLDPARTDAATVWVLDRWGPEEAAQDRPFVGPAANFLRATEDGLFGLVPVLERSATYATYLLPRYDSAAPPAAAYGGPATALRDAITALPHRRVLVVAMGTPVAHALGGHASLKDAFNAQLKALPGYPPHVVAVYTWSPAHVLKEPRLIRPIRDHVALVGRWLRGDRYVPSRPNRVPLSALHATHKD